MPSPPPTANGPPAPPPPAPLPPSHTLPAPFHTSTTPLTPLAQGAEALLFRTTLLSPTTPCALKVRPPKPYRHPTLDKRLTKARLLAEARVLVKCRREGVKVPAVLAADWEAGWVGLEWVEGGTVRAVLDGWVGGLGGESGVGGGRGEGERDGDEDAGGEARRGLYDLMARVGRAVGRMHEIGVCHGDLTTSNLMLRPPRGGGGGEEGVADALGEDEPTKDELEREREREAVRASLAAGQGTVSAQREAAITDTGTTPPTPPSAPPSSTAPAALTSLAGDIVLIDFGLATQSSHDEDRAVDLYVLERAFAATHPAAKPLFREVLRVYADSYRGAKVVLKRLEDVRMRGRKRSMLG
ncbi:kinase-like protein [Cenococcum geophilum]